MVYYWPVAIGQQVFAEGDINWLFLPIRTELARALAAGRLPLWSPGLQAGFPLFAEGEVAALYPLNLIAYRLLPATLANSYLTLFNLAWASIGMYLLVRSSGLRVSSALLAGFVFGFSGFVTAQNSHLPHLTVAAWLPWLIFFQQKYWRARSEGKNSLIWFLLASGSIGLQFLAGFPQFAFFSLVVYALSGFFGPLLWRSPVDLPRTGLVGIFRVWLPKAAFVTSSSILLGAGIAAIQLLPTYELIGLSIRGQSLSKYFFTSYSLDPIYLTQFLVPFWQLGTPHAFNMEYWGYVGLLPISLALITPFLRRNARTLFFVALALLALALALGGNTPIYDWLYYVPLFNRFRVPARFLFLFTFAAAFLAALGFEEIGNRLHNVRRKVWLERVLGLTVPAVIAWTIYQAYNQPVESWMDAWWLLPALLISASTGAILLARFRWVSQKTWQVIVLGLTVFDLAAFSAPFLSNLARMAPPAELIQVPRTVLAMNSAQPHYRVIVDKHPYTSGAIRASLWTNLPLIYDKQGVKSYLPSLGIQRNDQYVQAMSLEMRNLINTRYYLLPLETFVAGDPLPPPFDETEPYGGLTLSILSEQPSLPPTRVARLELVSYTDETGDLANGTVIGEIVLRLATGESKTFPIRLGVETADWAYDGLRKIGNVNHSKPSGAQAFPAYLKSVGRTFDGHKYLAQYDVDAGAAPPTVIAVGVRSLLPGSGLTIESISLIDEQERSVSLASLLQRQDLALAFRSHTAAMWENRDVLPRAFVVHQAQVTNDEEALTRMQAPDFRADQIVLLADGPSLDAHEDATLSKSRDQVAITEYKPERVALNVKSSRDGYLVLTDTWYPGWVAYVDGKEIPIYRADYVFRAVRLTAGEHVVVFDYKPASVLWGAVISALSLLIGGVIAVGCIKRTNEPVAT
ncbi:MAG: YfhO family protein [Chloroflexi bacterium]|nr:YfhO family protein [Chloroflexota bacterium]